MNVNLNQNSSIKIFFHLKTYQEVLDYLFEQLPMFQRIGAAAFKKDLTNTIALCKALNNPEKKFKSIHIAGTNGKGSVTHIIAAILQAAGYKVGCYTSPHYKDFRERIKINGQLIPEQSVVEFVNQNIELIKNIKPSFFEITVAMAFDYFANENVDIAVIETGMGGNFDSTNVIIPELSIITNISYDHQQFLGNTLPEIAGEKAGIIKQNVPIIIGENQPEIEHVFRNKAKKTNSKIYYSEEICTTSSFFPSGSLNTFRLISKDLQDLLLTDLMGDYQLKNLQTALAAILLLKDKYKISDGDMRQGLVSIREKTYFLGRCMTLSTNPTCLADSAHNEAGINELISIINNFKYQKLHFVYGTVADKDLSKIFPLLPKDATYYLCKPNIPRGMEVEILLEKMQENNFDASAFNSVTEAFKAAKLNADIDDLIVVSGSIFVVAEVI